MFNELSYIFSIFEKVLTLIAIVGWFIALRSEHQPFSCLHVINNWIPNQISKPWRSPFMASLEIRAQTELELRRGIKSCVFIICAILLPEDQWNFENCWALVHCLSTLALPHYDTGFLFFDYSFESAAFVLAIIWYIRQLFPEAPFRESFVRLVDVWNSQACYQTKWDYYLNWDFISKLWFRNDLQSCNIVKQVFCPK